jgi:hypothetical protein
MPDWESLVREQLAGLSLEPNESREVISEFADHLEDVYISLRGEGISECEAARRTLSQVSDWSDLRQEILLARTKERTMAPRAIQLWLPGMLTFLVSMVLLEIVQKIGPKPIILSLDKGIPILMFYTSWLLMLPLAGAMGAYLSHRARGSSRLVLASSLFPILPLVTVFLIAFPIGLAMGHGLAPKTFLVVGVEWVLLPAVALLAGGMPTQYLLSRRATSGHVTSA